MNKNPRIYFHENGIVWEWWRHHTHFINKHLENQLWFIEEEKIVRIGFSKPLFERINLYYDGHTVKGFTFLGMSITVGYSYHSRPVVDIEKELKENENAPH